MKMVPLPKLKAIVSFFANYTDPKFLGKVKLMKLFYFLDFTHLKTYGVPVTYDKYVHLEYGPIPSTIKNLVDTASEDIDSSELAETISFETPKNTQMYRIVSKKKFTKEDRKYFTPSEWEILGKVCSRFGDKITKYIVEASHKEAPWKETSFLEEIPYTLAAKDRDSSFTKEELAILLEV